jgi:hypothetical protein
MSLRGKRRVWELVPELVVLRFNIFYEEGEMEREKEKKEARVGFTMVMHP